jgi:hypothetical protein
MPAETPRPRRSQVDRRAETRAALLEAAARGLSRYGYGNLNLADVATSHLWRTRTMTPFRRWSRWRAATSPTAETDGRGS